MPRTAAVVLLAGVTLAGCVPIVSDPRAPSPQSAGGAVGALVDALLVGPPRATRTHTETPFHLQTRAEREMTEARLHSGRRWVGVAWGAFTASLTMAAACDGGGPGTAWQPEYWTVCDRRAVAALVGIGALGGRRGLAQTGAWEDATFWTQALGPLHRQATFWR